MQDQKTYLIVNTVPNTDDIESFQSYLAQIIVIFKQFGATDGQRFKTVEQVMGNGNIKAIAVFQFPSHQSIKDMIISKEFQALNDLRKKAYKQEVDLMICNHL